MRKIFRLLSLTIICMIIYPLPIFAIGTSKLPSGIDYTDIKKSIDSYFAENEKTSAGMLMGVFTESNILYEGYYGYSDKENNIAARTNTVMEWGSSTKILVWVSVMQLVEEGKLSLDEDITKYLPEDFLTKLKFDTPLTMYNLMHHNGGFEDNMLELFVTEKHNSTNLKATLQKTEPNQVFEPNEFTAYSNWGVALAGYIVECITGQAFYEYVHENIFDVLGMKHTSLNADLSDNAWVREARHNLKYYSASGTKLDIPYLYIPLYSAGMATGTLADFIRFGMALIPDKAGKSLLFKKRDTLEEFYTTSLYYADGKTPRNSHGLWASLYSVPVVGHAGNTAGCSVNLLISPTKGVGVVVMVNQAQEGVYNYGMMPLIFGEYKTTNTSNMPDVAEMEGMYLGTRATFSGMLKWTRLIPVISIMPFNKTADNTLTSPFSPRITAKQIEPYTYNFNLLDIKMTLKGNVSDTKTVMSVPMWDYVKTNKSTVVFWVATIVLFLLAAVYAIISLISTLIYLIKRKASKHLLKLRILNDISIILSFINFSILVFSVLFYFGTYTSVSIQGIFFIIFAIIPIIFTTIWITSRKKEISKKDKVWLILSSVFGIIMTFNVVFWNLYMAW